MAFSQATITSVSAQVDGCDLYISWSSSAPPNGRYQVYVDARLAWFGTSVNCRVPIPSRTSGRNLWIEVGTVGPGEQDHDYSANLTTQAARDRAELSWLGGTYLDPTGR